MRAICSRSDNRKNERKIKKHRKCVQRKCDCVCIILVARVFRCAEISYNNIFKKSNPKMSWVISMSYFFCALASCWLETGIQILDLYFHKLINYIEYPNDMINESNIICIDQFASVKHRRNNKRFSDNWRNAFFFSITSLHQLGTALRKKTNQWWFRCDFMVKFHPRSFFSCWDRGTNDII